MSVRAAASLALALATLACAVNAADPSPKVTKARNSAVGYALTLDQVTRSFAGKCGTVDRDSARVARAACNERTGELVRSADRYLEFVKRLVVNTQGELFERVRMPVGRLLAGFGKDGVVYMLSGNRTTGFYLERTSLPAARR